MSSTSFSALNTDASSTTAQAEGIHRQVTPKRTVHPSIAAAGSKLENILERKLQSHLPNAPLPKASNYASPAIRRTSSPIPSAESPLWGTSSNTANAVKQAGGVNALAIALGSSSRTRSPSPRPQHENPVDRIEQSAMSLPVTSETSPVPPPDVYPEVESQDTSQTSSAEEVEEVTELLMKIPEDDMTLQTPSLMSACYHTISTFFFGLLRTLVMAVRTNPGSLLLWLMIFGGMYLFRYGIMANSPLRTTSYGDYWSMSYEDSPYDFASALKEQTAKNDQLVMQMQWDRHAQAEESRKTQDKIYYLEALLSTHNTALPSDSSATSSMKDTLCELIDRVSKVEGKLADKEERVRSLEVSLASSLVSMAAMEGELAEKEGRVASLEVSLASSITAAAALEDELLAKVGREELEEEVGRKTTGLEIQMGEAMETQHEIQQDVRRLLHSLPSTQQVAAQALDEVQRLATLQQSALAKESTGRQDVYAGPAKDSYRPDLRKDYALYDNGGRIVPGLTSRTYEVARIAPHSAGFPPFPSLWTSLRLWSGSRTTIPIDSSVVITEDLVPGRCWPCGSTDCSLGVLLAHRIIVDEVVVSSPPLSSLLVPGATLQDFDVWGDVAGPVNRQLFAEYSTLFPLGNVTVPRAILGKASEFLHLGSFTYDKDGPPAQAFALRAWPREHAMDFGIVVLSLTSNQGAPFSCLYGITVHGQELLSA